MGERKKRRQRTRRSSRPRARARQLLEDPQGAVPRADASQQAGELVARLEGVRLDLARVLEQGERVAPRAAGAKPARSVEQRVHGVDGPPALHLEVGEREPEAMLPGEVHAGLAVDPDRLLDEALLVELPRGAAVALPGVRGLPGARQQRRDLAVHLQVVRVDREDLAVEGDGTLVSAPAGGPHRQVEQAGAIVGALAAQPSHGPPYRRAAGRTQDPGRPVRRGPAA